MKSLEELIQAVGRVARDGVKGGIGVVVAESNEFRRFRGLCLVFAIIFYSLSTTTEDMESNSKKAIISIIILFICEGMVKPYDIIYLRPCMGFWRVVLCIVQIYEYVLLFLLF